MELKSNFLGTTLDGQVECVARATHLGKTTQVWDATLTHAQSGRTLALFRCTQMVLYAEGGQPVSLRRKRRPSSSSCPRPSAGGGSACAFRPVGGWACRRTSPCCIPSCRRRKSRPSPGACRIRAARAGHFDFLLARVERFPGVLYLAPQPAAPFVALTEALVRAFPQYPPFGGAHEHIVPHLTVAQGDEPTLQQADAELRAALQEQGPVRAQCRELCLLHRRRRPLVGVAAAGACTLEGAPMR